jgi:hypothetical protein
VNPAHLETGTHQDNSTDMVERGRSAKGEQNGSRLHPERLARGEQISNAKLTYDDVVEIRVLLGFGVPNRQIAEQFDVGKSLVSKIKRGKIWKHVTPASRAQSPRHKCDNRICVKTQACMVVYAKS